MNKPSVRKNYIYRLLYEVLVLLTPFITTPYISRVLGADGIGNYSYTSSIMAYFTLFAGLGTASYGAQVIAQARDDREKSTRLFWEIWLMTVGTSLVCLCLWGLVIVFGGEYRYYFLALIPMLLATMVDISWFYTGHEQVKYIVIRNTICKLAGIILLFALIRDKDDVLLYVLINSGVQLLGNLSMWTYLPKMLGKVDFKTLEIKHHFRETLIYFIPSVATSVYTVLDKTLIGAITGSSYENGYYEQATKVINIVKTVAFTSVNSVMGARMAYLFAEKKDTEIRHRIDRSMDFILLLGIGCCFGIIGVAQQFVPVFFGSGYEPVVTLLYLMSPLIVIIGISNCLGWQYYTPSGQRARSARVILLGSAVNLCMNLLLIPKFGANGATAGSIAAELLITVLYVYMSDDYMSAKKLWQVAWRRLIAGAIMCAAIFVMQNVLTIRRSAALMVEIVAGCCIYGVILLVLRDKMLRELCSTGIGIVRKLLGGKKHG